jgi:hypothetical protein
VTHRNAGRATLALVVAASLPASSTRAAVLRVPGDYIFVSNAVAAAAAGDTVQVVGNGGAEFHTSDLRLEKDITIQGGWRADFALRDPSTYVTVLRDTTLQFAKPVIRVMGPYRVELDGVWIWGGRQGIVSEAGADLIVRNCTVRGQINRTAAQDPDLARGGGMRVVGGSVLLENSKITTIATWFSGAGIAVIDASSFVMRNSRIESCASAGGGFDAPGAGLYLRNVPHVEVTDSRLAQCSTLQRGGGAYLLQVTATFANCEFDRGLATYGGGVFVDACPAAVLDRCRFVQSRAYQGGGAIGAENAVGLDVRDCVFESNHAGLVGQPVKQGGALWLRSTQFSIEGSEFDSNHIDQPGSIAVATEGGAAYSQTSSGTIANSSFRNEKATGKGGAWFQIGGDVQFTGCRFEDNEAGIFGGGVAIELGGEMHLDHSLLAGNRAKFGGGISSSFTGLVSVVHCTVAEGSGTSAGGAVYVDTGGTVGLLDSILCCSLSGEVVYCAGGGVTADHCDVWNDDAVNVRVEWGGECTDPSGTNGNLRVSPDFCLADPDFHISPTSPCAGTASDLSDRGWLPAGCSGPAPTAVESLSWGRIKAAWR